MFPFVQWASCEHMDCSAAHMRQEELAFSSSVVGDKLPVLFIFPKGLCIWNAGFIKCTKHNKRKICHLMLRRCSRSQVRALRLLTGIRPNQEPILWLGLIRWVRDGFAPVEIKLSDQMVEAALRLTFLESWHQRIDCKLFCNSVILSMAAFCRESQACTSERESRGSACQGRICTQVLVSKASLRLWWEHNSWQRKEPKEGTRLGVRRPESPSLSPGQLLSSRRAFGRSPLLSDFRLRTSKLRGLE